MSTDQQLNHQLADRLRHVRDVHLLSRSSMSELIHTPASTIKNYELRYREASAVFLIKMSQCFGGDWGLWVLGLTEIQPEPIIHIIRSKGKKA